MTPSRMDARRMVLGVGSNLGSREALLRAAAELVAAVPGVSLLARSRLWETAPVGTVGPEFLNAALLLRTALDADALLGHTQRIEALLGRARRERWGPRTLDLDLLWIEGTVVRTPRATVPHAELSRRPFALAPLVELVPDARDPATGALYADLLAALPPGWRDAPRELPAGFASAAMEHTADEGFEVWAQDRADLLAAAAEALGALVVDPATVAPGACVELAVEAPAGELLGDDDRLYAWLAEVLYHLDARRFAVRRAVVFDDAVGGVRGALVGEALDEARHGVRGALKAVTYHALQVGPAASGGWRARVVVDV